MAEASVASAAVIGPTRDYGPSLVYFTYEVTSISVIGSKCAQDAVER